MSFTWEQLFDIADELLDSGSGHDKKEAYYRSAINRSYYAAHKFACEWLEERGFECPVEGAHTAVINSLETIKSRDARRAARKLEAIRLQRISADYYLNMGIDAAKAQTTLQTARAVCNDIRSILD